RDEQVEQDEVGTIGRDPAQRVLTARRAGHLVAAHGQPLGEQIQAVPIVIDDQDPELARRHRGLFRWGGGALSLHERPRSRGLLLSPIAWLFYTTGRIGLQRENPGLTRVCEDPTSGGRRVVKEMARRPARQRGAAAGAATWPHEARNEACSR